MPSCSASIEGPRSGLGKQLYRAHVAGRLVEQLLRAYPDINVATLRLAERDGAFIVEGEVPEREE